MRRMLQIVALALLLGTAVWWLAAGANRGWTKTSVPVKTLDEVTGIEGITYEKRMVPGVELLAAAVMGSLVIGSASFLFPKRKQMTPSN
jgi:hypothetical protein